ncbi:MAG: hypothetical protein K2M76_07485 [Muribaculaceae bacterium]|nr:hypothetical protein [Muribaculaceae bacterium]
MKTDCDVMVMPAGLCDGVSVTECCNLRMGRDGLVPAMGDVATVAPGDAYDYDATAESVAAVAATIGLRMVAAGDVTVGMGPMVLTGNYIRCQGRLDGRDASLVGRMLAEAWADAAERAKSGGVLMHPRVGGWRLRDASGSVVYTSVPVLLSGASGAGSVFSELEPVTAQITKDGSGNFNQVAATTLTVPTAEVWMGSTGVAASVPAECTGMQVEVLMMPGIDLIDGTTAGSWLSEINSSTGRLMLRMPGAYSGNAPATAKGVAAIERQLAEWPEGAAVTGCYDVGEALKGVRVPTDAMSWHGDGGGEAVRFKAGVRYDSGDSCVYGDVKIEVDRQMLPVQHATGDVELTTGRQQTVTRYSNGAVTVASATTGYVPVSAGAMIVAYGREAVSMTIEAETANGKRMASVPLRRAPGRGDYSYWISPTLQRLALADSDDEYAEVAPEGDAGIRAENMVMIAAAEWPRVPTARIMLTEAGRIYCIERAAGASATWNFGRRHYVVWAEGGVYGLTANANGNRLAASLISRTGISRYGSVAAAPDALYAATTRGQAVMLTGNEVRPCTKSMLPDGHVWQTATYDMTHDEVRWTDSTGLVAVMPRKGRGWWMQRGLVAAGEPVRVIWRGRRHTRCAGRRMLTGVKVDISSTECRIDVRVTGDGGSAEAAVTIMEANIAGSVTMPVTIPIRCMMPEWLTVTIEGDVDAASTLRHIHLLTAEMPMW